MSDQIEYVIDGSRRKFFDWKEIWQYRELFYFFTWRDVKVKYKQTYLGIAWVLIQPLLMVSIFTFFFGSVARFATPVPYPLYVLSGLLLWNFFAASINNGGTSMLSHASIIKKIYFPRLIVPISAMLSCLVDAFITFLIFIGMAVYYKVSIDPVAILIFWPLALLCLIVGTVGLSTWLSALVVKYRDFRYVIPFALQLGLFVSPILYSFSSAQSYFGKVLALNPVYAPLELFRHPFIGGEMDGMMIATSILSSIFLLVMGLYYFKKTENFFADIA